MGLFVTVNSVHVQKERKQTVNENGHMRRLGERNNKNPLEETLCILFVIWTFTLY